MTRDPALGTLRSAQGPVLSRPDLLVGLLPDSADLPTSSSELDGHLYLLRLGIDILVVGLDERVPRVERRRSKMRDSR